MKKIHLLTLSFFIVFFSQAQTAENLYNTGLENVKKINRVEAQENFNQAIAKKPDYADAFYQRGLLNKHFHKMDDAKSDFNKVVSLNKNFVKEAHIELGDMLYNEKEFDKAILSYNAVIALDTSFQKAYLHRGKCYYYTKKLNESVSDLNKTNTIKANDEAYFFLGLNAIEIEDWANSESHFSKAIELNNKNAEYYLLRGSAYYSQADDPEDNHHNELLKKALSDYDKALELDDKLEEAYFERGEVKMDIADYKGAIADFQKAIKLSPNDLDAHYLKAMCNFHYGFEEQAKNELEDILKKDPNFEDALYELGRISLDEENLEAAISYFDKLIGLGSTDSDVYLFRAYARLDLGDSSGACEDFTKADELGDKEAHQKMHKYCK